MAAVSKSLFGVNPDTYQPHELHRPGSAYPETNCYVDVIIEMLHAAGHEPLAVMACALLLDFEGDQFTFFKPEPDAIRQLYGIDIHEMQPYRQLPVQICEQLRAGRTLIVEADSWYLPDTHGTSYRQEHVKSSIVPEWIDTDGEMLHYFHNGGLYRLGAEDYRGALRVEIPIGDLRLPPYTELVRFDRGEALRGESLNKASRELLRDVLHRPRDGNPFAAYAVRLETELESLTAGEPERVAAHVFATARMAGAAAAVGAAYIRWLLGEPAQHIATALDAVASSCTTLSFRLARRRMFDPYPLLQAAGESWGQALDGLHELVG